MEIEFENEYLADLYEGKKVKGKPVYQQEIIKKFIKTVNILKSTPRIETLFQMNSLNYEKLSGDKNGFNSVRVTKQFRLELREIMSPENKIFKFIISGLSNHYE